MKIFSYLWLGTCFLAAIYSSTNAYADTLRFNENGLEISSADKQFSALIGGNFQYDTRNFINNAEDDDSLFRRLRPSVLLKFGDKISARFTHEFSNNKSLLFDGFVDYKIDRFFTLRVGKFTAPVSQERLQSAGDIHFIERGFSQNLAPNRDIGIMAYGELPLYNTEYQFGVFNGSADISNEDEDLDNHKDLILRVMFSPLEHSEHAILRAWKMGIGSTIGKREGFPDRAMLGNYRTPAQLNMFRYNGDSYADGLSYRIFPQTQLYYNKWSMAGEYGISSFRVRNDVYNNRLTHHTYDLSLGYLFTDHEADFNGPKNLPKCVSANDLGGLEVVSRISNMQIDSQTYPHFADRDNSIESAFSLSGGLNWYLTKNIKFSTTYFHTTLEGGGVNLTNRETEQVILTRSQIQF